MKKIGIDLGSSTAKIVILDENNRLFFKYYQSHRGQVKQVLLEALAVVKALSADEKMSVAMTGTAGMGLSGRIGVPFVQEVIASSRAVKIFYPDVSTFIELGGEDAKIILFREGQSPEMRMNGSCAGGTGSFIDQMAMLLNVDLKTLNEFAKHSTKKLHIASRCGVFAKTDVQALLNKGETKEDIARAVFNAVAQQTVSTLLSGAEIKARLLFAGGPLSFLSSLRTAFHETLEMPEKNFILPKNAEVLVAIGAALRSGDRNVAFSLNGLIHALKNEKKGVETIRRLDPLFGNADEFKKFQERHDALRVESVDSKSVHGDLYLGIDAGSTTTKFVLIDEYKRLVGHYYSANFGSPLEVAVKGLTEFKDLFEKHTIRAAFATGYGEDFIRVALNLDGGIVETMAHYTAGSLFKPDISYIVDIGGQDIKAMKVENHIVSNIELNEACSSGTGSFIQTFAEQLGMSVDEFVEQALFAKRPVDLGTRCSVFMNSKVKEALKDGVEVPDIAAGLAYSVVKNALYKVIKLKSSDELGDQIFVQGGTFKNSAVLRAFEKLTEKQVYRLNISEYMGAYGAALYARSYAAQVPGFHSKFDFRKLDQIAFEKKSFTCHGCGNLCEVTRFTFSNKNIFYTGNRCEKHFSNHGGKELKGENFFRIKERLIFDFEKELGIQFPKIDAKKPVIGLPRVLSVYEHYPFFKTLFASLGFKVELSSLTTRENFIRGLRTVTADNICLPAKVANGHILELIDSGVDRIFYPSIIYENKEGEDAKNSFNCPVVTGYGEVLKKSIKSPIPIDSIPLSFRYRKGMRINLYQYLKPFGVKKTQVRHALGKATAVAKKMLTKQKELAVQVIRRAKEEAKPLLVVMGRPYHLDPMVNNGIMDLIHELGAYAISENAIPGLEKINLRGVLPLTQWSYHNRLYKAAKWLATQDYERVAAVQLNSFGCGPDAVVVDEVKTLVETAGKIHISIKIDEMSNLGAAKIRIRSVLEALGQNRFFSLRPRLLPRAYAKSDRKKTILVPFMSRMYSQMMEPVFYHLGYRIETLYHQNHDAVEEGLKYVNNDMCYPAIVVIGDLIKALKSGKYDPKNTVVALSQTGGQCRASNYVPMLKRALADAGFLDTPVVSLSADAFADGFVFNPIKLLRYSSMLFAITDVVMRMKSRTKPYEIQKGETDALVENLTEELRSIAFQQKPSVKMIKSFIRDAIGRFNRIPVNYIPEKAKKVGIVGEIYLKTNCFSNNHVVDWLEEKGYEVDVPSFLKFFEYGYFSSLYNLREHIHIEPLKLLTGSTTHLTIRHYTKMMEKELRAFDRYEPEKPLKEVLKDNKVPVPLYIKFGEGWLLAAEITEMMRRGVKNVISLQPFGCISNHIIAKGMYRTLREDYGANLLMLDFEAGTSDANVINRIELFLSEEEVEQENLKELASEQEGESAAL